MTEAATVTAEATTATTAAPPATAATTQATTQASQAATTTQATTTTQSTDAATTSTEKSLSAEDLKLAGDILNRDWTADLPDDLKETGKRFSSKADAVRALIDFRKRESQVRVPGKDAKPEEIAAYHKAIGVPEKPEEYQFFDAEGAVVTEEMKAERAEWGKRFQSLGISKDTAKKLSQFVTEDNQRTLQAQIDADKRFAEQSEAALRREWPGEEYERNKTYANNAFREIAAKVGLSVDELVKVETKDGRFLMDRPDMLRIFSAIGREMAEGTLGPTLTESEKDNLDDQIRDVRAKQTEAQNNGDSQLANKLYQREQALIAKRDGSKSVVGSRGRMV